MLVVLRLISNSLQACQFVYLHLNLNIRSVFPFFGRINIYFSHIPSSPLSSIAITESIIIHHLFCAGGCFLQ